MNYKKSAVLHGLSMAVFLGACLGVQANDHEKGVSAQATVNTDRSTTSSTSTDRNQDGKLSRGDANFIKEAAQGGMLEVKLGQTAKDHASNAEVKNYGEMLVKHHSKANDKLASLAAQKGVNLAKELEPKHTNMIMDMEKKAGQDFDREFVQTAIKEHRKDISKFEKASRDLNDAELRAFASETLPTLRDHLNEAERMAKSIGVNVTARNIDSTEDGASVSAAAAAGSPGLSASDRNSSVNRVDVDVDHDRDAKAEVKAEVDTDDGDGKTLGVKTEAGDDETLGIETKKGDGKVLGIQTGPGDGKTLGLNTSKDDGKLLGIIPAPGRNDAENRVDVDVDRDDASIEVNADADIDRDRDAAIGAPAGSEKGASAKVEGSVNTDADRDNVNFDQLPAKVRSTIKEQAGSQNIKNAKRHTMNGKTAYKVEIQKDGRNRILHVAEDGTIIKDNENK